MTMCKKGKADIEMINKSLLRGVTTRMAGSATILLLAMGVLGSQQALAGISSTKHNLTITGTGTNQFSPTAGGGEICVFCHTPHGADTTAAVPLWNRALASPATYTTYNSLGTSSLDGATMPVGSVSIACLSCHDGVQAMNTMINAPGSGGYNSAGGTWAGGWAGTNQTLGVLKAGIITNLTTDLRNDHPIGVQYGGGPKTAGLLIAGTDYSSFVDADFNTAKGLSLNSKPVWYVETGGAATGRQKTDIQLYTRGGETGAAFVAGNGGFAAASVPQPFVECASCHDPHTETTTFLRIANTGSAVCLACHIK